MVEDSKGLPLELIENRIAYNIIRLVNILDYNEDISNQKKKADFLNYILG